MASKLLEKEEEFHKLNNELEMRTKVLMHENCIGQDRSSKCSISNDSCSGSGGATRIPEDAKTVSTSNKSIVQFLKTKITLLENELGEYRAKFKCKCTEHKQAVAENAKLTEERDKWLNLAQSLREQKEKIGDQIAIVNGQLQSKENESSALKKENESLRKELKMVCQNLSGQETRLGKALEEVERAKAQLRCARQEDKDEREGLRRQISELTVANRRFERQVSELVGGFRKEMQLIDALKKENMYLEGARTVRVTEEEFEKCLNTKPSSNK